LTTYYLLLKSRNKSGEKKGLKEKAAGREGIKRKRGGGNGNEAPQLKFLATPLDNTVRKKLASKVERQCDIATLSPPLLMSLQPENVKNQMSNLLNGKLPASLVNRGGET